MGGGSLSGGGGSGRGLRVDKEEHWLNPLEDEDQAALAEYLDTLGVLWCHVPNGGVRHIATAKRLKRMGTKKGVADNFIFDPPLEFPEYVGTVIELKRKQGGKVSAEQERWLEGLRRRGWYTAVCYGVDDAIAMINHLGYGKRRR